MSLASLNSSISASETQAIIEALAAKVRFNYVLQDKADAIAKAIETALAEGKYENLTGEKLSEAVTSDLRSVNGDKHLKLVFSPKHVIEEEPPKDLTKKYNSDGDEVDDEGKVVEQEGSAVVDANMLSFHEFCSYNGHGVAGVEILPGNIGFLTLTMIGPPGLVEPFWASAMTLLQHTNAIIVDLRKNSGGAGSGGLLSYFMSGRKHYKSMFWVPENVTSKDYTLETVSGPRYNDSNPDTPKRPVYILTSSKTFSSAEAFTFFMLDLELGQTVGETTSGGGHPCAFVRAGHDHFEASISVGRTFSPKTGLGWEKIGVPPTVPCAAGDAKDVAHLLCLKTVEARLAALQPPALTKAMAKLLPTVEEVRKSLDAKVGHATRAAGTPVKKTTTTTTTTTKSLSPQGLLTTTTKSSIITDYQNIA
ncbi:hypothetical protein HK100_011894 [Physocladia obscura]|uniref:Tail specific protease domain-containing protein n=1 Tax=Physocladia obscura TaxID=109957 RepID=A0AAD5T6K3_9FUNG|nr:hypothetical protein HK100_011894 [Physocladia obscura]